MSIVGVDLIAKLRDSIKLLTFPGLKATSQLTSHFDFGFLDVRAHVQSPIWNHDVG